MKYILYILILSCAIFTQQEASAVEIRRTPLRITQGGTAEKPAVYDGQGMVIDLGVDVTDRVWTKNGDVWTSTTPLYVSNPMDTGQGTALYIDEIPLILARDRAAEKAATAPIPPPGYRYQPPSALSPGQMGFTDDGLIYFRWPEGKTPGKSRIIALPKAGTSCVSIECSYITVRNITAIHAANDGFNIHGARLGVRLENVKAFSNADEGISAHETVQMEVDGAEVAWNGSYDGGVTDVNESVTTYRHCIVHDNAGAAAFRFMGKSHVVTDTVIYNQAKDFSIAAGTQFQQERIEHR